MTHQVGKSDLGKGPKIKKRESMVFDYRGGKGVTQNQILIQTSFYSVNLTIFSANLKTSEEKDHS